jgi:hypothetical protein
MPLSSSIIFHEEKLLTIVHHTLNSASFNAKPERKGVGSLEQYITDDGLYKAQQSRMCISKVEEEGGGSRREQR